MKVRTAVALALLLLMASSLPWLTTGAAAAPAQNHTITAVVVDNTGVALSNVKIEISNTTSGVITTYYGYTNSSGKYVSQPLASGGYTVTASYQGYTSDGTRLVTLSTTNLTVNFTMTQLKGNLTGFVTTGSIPVSGATVVLNNSLVSFRTNSTAPLGFYSLAGIPNGTYTLSASKVGYVSTQKTNVSITAGGSDWYNLTVKPTLGIVTGTVNSTTQSGTNKPLAGVNVTLQGPVGTLHTTTNAEGAYYFTNLTQGTYTISVQINGYSPGQTTAIVSLAKTSYMNFTLVPLTRNTPFTIPGFIGNLDLDHSLVIVALIIVMVAVTGSMVLLNKSYNWKDERNTTEKGQGEDKGQEKKD